MISNTLSSSYVVNAPTEFMRAFSLSTQHKEMPLHAATLIRLVEGFIALLQDFYEESLKMSPQEAQMMLNTSGIETLSEEAIAVKLIIHQAETAELQAAMTTLVAYTEAVVMRIHDIASRGEIDEDSKEYNTFLADMAADITEKEGNSRIYGEKALFALFD